MSVRKGMFLFEVVVSNVRSLVESRQLIIRSEFANIFSLELKDPKQMYIVMPEPLPLPPQPAGKKGKKKKKPKPKPKKKKKGKKGKVVLPPPEPVIQAGQSILISSSAEFLIQLMKNNPIVLSLWSKEDTLCYMGATSIPWDPQFIRYLELLLSCNSETPKPVNIVDDYNIFEEATAKIMAKLGLSVKLTFLDEKCTTAFRTLSEDPIIKKCLYTGINSKTTSLICNMKTTDEMFEESCNKIENNFTFPSKSDIGKPIRYADYKNAPGANLTNYDMCDFCCPGNAHKPPDSIYDAPETCPDVDFIVDYIRKIIVSCNDQMRMLTPKKTIRPRIKATDIDRLCYCQEEKWPEGQFAQDFKKEVKTDPCALCVDAGKRPPGRGDTFDIANIRGPCGRTECRIARHMRAYIENLVDEDNMEFNINDLVGPCGSKKCSVAQRIQQLLRHEGPFKESHTLEGLSTQCACLEQMKEAMLLPLTTCDSECSNPCSEITDEESGETTETEDSEKDRKCGGPWCPFKKKKDKPDGPGGSPTIQYAVFYFTVEYNFEKKTPTTSPTPSSPSTSAKSSQHVYTEQSQPQQRYCSEYCPSMPEKPSCSKSICCVLGKKNETDKEESADEQKCKTGGVCPHILDYPPSPNDSNIVINFDDIHNPCCNESCDIADKVKHFIMEGVNAKQRKTTEEDPCYCDCVCDFNFSSKTTYCGVCGGYESLGNDLNDAPPHVLPHPCPIYHKTYNNKYFKTQSPWPEEEQAKDNLIVKKQSRSQTRQSRMSISRDRKEEDKVQGKPKSEKKKVGKFTTTKTEEESVPVEKKKPDTKYPYPPVPRNMGWNWTAEDIPGLKFRPKWRPGAANKILVRRYRTIREGIDNIAKKKRAMMQRRKRLEMKPTLVVTKLDGEYTVQMEVIKQYSKERLVYQYPYEENKPPIIYTIGKTPEEKLKIQKQRERKERRETRRKCRLLQSTFRDRCQEICVKAYDQAIGVLPLPNPNVPECPCQTGSDPNTSTIIDSCSCSDASSISSSDTDNDEWTIEFTPPLARYDAKAKHPPVLADNECQYNYLDYKVKVLDKAGNQVPRFFKGQDGQQECSDLGGFWGPDHVWMEINKDGYIGPDNRWVPMNFTGPDGMYYCAEDGLFTDNTGQTLKIGIDGYIDKDSKWVWYTKTRRGAKSVASVTTADTKRPVKAVEPDTKSKIDAKNPILKGKDVNKNASASPAKTNGNKTVSYGGKSKLVMNVTGNDRFRAPRAPPPMERLRIDPKRLARYREIMKGLEENDDLGELRPLAKATRASNTPQKRSSPYTVPRSVVRLHSMLETPNDVNPSTTVNLSTTQSSGYGTPLIRS